MAEITTLARPYAKAAFEYALEGGNLQSWSTMLSTAAAVSLDEVVGKALASPSLTTKQLADLFIDLIGDELNEQGQNFVCTLADNKRLSLLPEIAQLFDQLKSEQEKSVEVEITSAFPLGEDASQQLQQALSRSLARDIRIETSVDQGLIGGVLVRAGDTVIDGSVRGKLLKLAESMGS